jgi:RNA polymerase sigma factor for flagellar operon FliA
MNVKKRYPSQAKSVEADLVRNHTDLVKRIAYHVAARLPPSVDVEDLIQAGIVGLLEAARHYNGERGASFETYAGIRIRGAIMDELRRGDWAPRSVHRRHREIAAAMRAIEQRTGREAREEEIIKELGISADAYHAAMQDAVQCQVLSLDTPTQDGEPGFDAVDASGEPLQNIEDEEFQDLIATAIQELPERERLVLSLYYNEEMNLREIGAVLEVSESRVCQIHGQALLRLRARLADSGMKVGSRAVA